MRLRDTPIQRKLMSVILLTCAVVLSLMCTAYIILESVSFKNIVKSNLSTLGDVIATNSSAALAFDNATDAEEVLNALSAEENILMACLYKMDSSVFATYPADTLASVFPEMRNRNIYWLEGNFLHGYQPVIQRGEQLGVLYIQSDLRAMYQQLQKFAFIGLALIVGSLFVAYLLSRLLQGAISEPILELEQTARVISEKKDYSVRALKGGNDEVGALTDAFNHMLTQIELQNSEITSFNQKLEQKVDERTSELQHQKEFVETIINSSVDLVTVFNRDLQYLMLNKRALEYYGVNEGELIGKNLLEVFPEKVGMNRDLTKALTGVPVHNPRYKSPIRNRTFENFYLPLKDKDETIYGVLSIGHDITSIMEANEMLEKVNAELMKSNRDLEQFAYVASHDLQEPLRKIQTFTQLLEANAGDEEKRKKYQEKINQSSQRMKQLIQDMLNFSRISNSEDAFVPTDLNEILENLIIDFELLLTEKEADIRYPRLPVVPGIPLQLSQLFSNIINNSLKYTEGKPVIDITCERLTAEELGQYPKLNRDIPYFKIQFKDNGIGFEPQYNEQIFAIFQRLHGKQSYSGTGIGLALCKKIVENHEGIIYAEGVPDEGATFTIILPGKTSDLPKMERLN